MLGDTDCSYMLYAVEQLVSDVELPSNLEAVFSHVILANKYACIVHQDV